MKLSQAIRKLGRVPLHGFNSQTREWDDLQIKALFEVSGRWVSERSSFSSRRVMLTEKEVLPYTVVKFKGSGVSHIVYSQQENILQEGIYTYDYTLLDETDEAQTVSFVTTLAASGLAGDTTEELSESYPVHMVRYAGTTSKEAEFHLYSRLYAFAPGDVEITTDQELLIAGERYLVEESFTELYATRLMLTRR